MLIGEKIKEIRKSKKLSQEQLANKCGLNRNSIYNYETGKRSPRAHDLELIAAALEIPIIDFIGFSDFDTNQKIIISECTHWISEYISLCGYEDEIKAQGELIDILEGLKTISQLKNCDNKYDLYKEIKEFIMFKLSTNK